MTIEHDVNALLPRRLQGVRRRRPSLAGFAG